MRRAYRVCAALALAASTLACGFPVDDSKYEVEATTDFEKIVSAFSSGEACEACLLGSCPDEIKTCAATEGCTEFAKCVRDQANPAGSARCLAGELDVTFAANVAYTGVAYCWAECKSQCAVGTNWDCLDGYSVTRPPSTTVAIQQSFTQVCGAAHVRGARVNYCDDADNCTEKAVTDEKGTYTVELPINVNRPVAGWRGYRYVIGAASSDQKEALKAHHRLERNLPIWSDQVEFTQLLSESCAFMASLGLYGKDSTVNWFSGAIGVQTFDCHTSGAEGVVLEVETAPDASIWYTKDDGGGLDYISEHSTASGAGLGLVGNLPDGEHKIVARETKSGKVVGYASVTVPTNDVILYSVLPAPRDE